MGRGEGVGVVNSGQLIRFCVSVLTNRRIVSMILSFVVLHKGGVSTWAGGGGRSGVVNSGQLIIFRECSELTKFLRSHKVVKMA